MSVRSSSPAPNSSSTAVVTSPPTSRLRSFPPPVTVRLSEARLTGDEKVVACHAGATPNRSPTASAASAQNATTRRSNCSVTVPGSRPSGISAGAAWRIAQPTPIPSVPPIADSTTLSVTSWRTILRRPAPSAARTASSRVRAVARASRRLATLAQQMSSTKPTTPRNSIDVTLRSLPIIVSCIGSSRTLRPALVCGNSRERPSATACRSDCAAAMPTPGWSRPTTWSANAPRARGGRLVIDRMAHIDGVAQDLELLRDDADHGPQRAIQLDLTADDGRIAIEPRLPERLAQHDHVGALLVVRGKKRAARDRMDAEHVENARRDPLPGDGFGVAVGARHHHAADVRRKAGDRLERAAARLPVEHVERRAVAARVRLGPLPDRDQPSGITVGQRLQQRRVDKGKYRAVRADSQCQGQHRHDREPRCPPQLPPRELHIVPELFEPQSCTHLSISLRPCKVPSKPSAWIGLRKSRPALWDAIHISHRQAAWGGPKRPDQWQRIAASSARAPARSGWPSRRGRWPRPAGATTVRSSGRRRRRCDADCGVHREDRRGESRRPALRRDARTGSVGALRTERHEAEDRP